MEATTPDIGLLYEDQYPEALFDDFRDLVATDGLNLRVESRATINAYAGLEWMLPTGVMLFVASSYFNGFLGEMGKDHYQALKAGVRLLKDRLARVNVTLIGSAGKVSKEQPYSLVYSIWFGPIEGYSFKFLVPNDPAESEVALEAYLDFVEKFALAMRSPEKVAALLEASGTTRVILLAYNPGSSQIERIDHRTKRFDPI